jgi:hypothetical protein
LGFRITRERPIGVHARDSREEHKVSRVEDRRKMPLVCDVGKFAGYQRVCMTVPILTVRARGAAQRAGWYPECRPQRSPRSFSTR